MVEISRIETGKGKALGIKLKLPNDVFLIILANKGYLACGYLDVKDVEGINHIAATFTNVRTFDDMLEAKVKMLTNAAANLGVTEEMSGREVLTMLM